MIPAADGAAATSDLLDRYSPFAEIVDDVLAGQKGTKSRLKRDFREAE
jgi:hypothetical protein